MGGGVGISMPARFRIATENTTYAMPETGIGLFPDVGGGWYLPRKPGQIGMWLALTGARIKAADCLEAGIATHYVEAAKLDELKQALLCPRPSRAGAGEGCARRPCRKRAHAPPPNPRPQGGGSSRCALATSPRPGAPRELTPENIARINRIFALDSVEAIFAALEADGSDWAKAQLATLQTKSPQTLKVAFRQLREGARMPSFADEMRQEYRIAARVSARHDFLEGVRALIVDKDNKPPGTRPRSQASPTPCSTTSSRRCRPDEEWSPLP